MNSKQLDNWFLGKQRKIYSKDHLPHSRKGLSFKQGSGLKNLTSAALKKPEVIVKIPKTKSSKTGLSAAASHLDYISRNGKLTLENQDGELIKGKKDIKAQVVNEWAKLGIAPETKYKEHLNVVLSMPPSTDPRAVKNAARDFAKEVFKDHQYVFVLHTDEKHPHVHICVTMRDDRGVRMNPRKNDLFEWRVKFAEKMREHGVDCAATKRQHRGVIQKPENSTVRSITKRNGFSTAKQNEVDALMKSIKQQERPTNPFIQKQLETRGFIVSEYKILAKALYAEGMKREAKIISSLAKEVEASPTNTKLQDKYDLITGHNQTRETAHPEKDHDDLER